MIWNLILVVGFLLAITVGRGDLRVAVAMAANFAVSVIVRINLPDGADVGLVSLADFATASVLLAFGQRGQFIALLYLICAVVNAAGAILQWPSAATYAILDPIGWLMLVVLGHGDSGIRRISRSYRGFGGRNRVPAYLTGKRDNSRVTVAMVSGENKGLGHGR